MGFNCGIIGLPNVGKSTLFNALMQKDTAQAANYPFCTIEPNIGRVAVPDERLYTLASVAGSKTIVPTSLEFVDIAGLVQGASKGEGLGNQFLANIREVDAIIHVLRCFENNNIVHVEGKIDPIHDAEVVETELMLADLESLERRIIPLRKKAHSGNNKDTCRQINLIESLIAGLQQGCPVRFLANEGKEEDLKSLQLLTSKPVLYVCNVEEAAVTDGNEYSSGIIRKANKEKASVVIVSAAIESEIGQLDTVEQRDEFLKDMGLSGSGLDRIVASGYKLLDLITYFTCGPKEIHAWTIRRGTKAPQASAAIHSDFERGFIACEAISYGDYIRFRGDVGAKDAGRQRIEGRDYVVQDGDILIFRFNV